MSANMPHRRGEHGQAALFATMTLVVSLGLTGLVVDEGWAYWRKEAAITAAQAGASAAVNFAKSKFPSGAVTCNQSGVICQATAVQCPTGLTVPAATGASDNKTSACEFAKFNGFSVDNSKQNVTFEANNTSPPSGSGASAASTVYYVTVRTVERVPLTFLSVIAHDTGSLVTANATAALVSSSVANCIYVLDSTGKDALNATNAASVNANCAIMVDSNNTEAALSQGGAVVKTIGSPQQPIEVAGTCVANNGGSFSPSCSHTSQFSDPLSSLEIPWTNCTGAGCPTTNCEYTGCTGAANHCDFNNMSVTTFQGSPKVLTPGIYCGGINVSNGSSVTFSPGMYVINGGGVNIQSGASNTGSGVIFYLTGTNSNYGGITIGNGAQGVVLTPVTSGHLAGVLIYQDPSLTPTAPQSVCSYGGAAGASIICGGSTVSLTGIVYLKTTTLAFTNGTSTQGGMALVVKDLLANGGSHAFQPDPYGTLSGSSNGGPNSPYLIGAN